MKKYNVDVVEYESDDQMNEKKLIEVKNKCWKGSTADWVIVGDIDELIFSENLLEDLKTAKELGYTIIETDFFDMVSDVFPSHDGNIHDVVKEGVYAKEYRKALAFRPDCIKEINYSIGGHSCNPSGEVKFLHRSKIITLHYRYLSLEYLIHRYQAYNNRVTKESRDKGWGIQYRAGIDQLTTVYQNMWNNKVKVVD
jgi:hypothetical protein